ncbi:hypothetical protein J2T08_002957 [Neorhizobium galegae]|uniref:DUF2806 domain-containing protein n=1 Tax=Neorhizobium galegae TaxID=399 RepID=UPI0027806471|nr:DUF2806 domain-containing protein [Neorhizobium galegae]MDQ0135036.1 hypothetical protein [Neorhizobium galegae]
MSQENEPQLPATWTDIIKSIAEGGVPQILAGPAGKAISRLIAGATDIPAAWLEQKAQAIKDQTEARKTIMQAIAKASANAAVADPELLDRALERHVAELYKKQENREDVARRTVEQLATEPNQANMSDGPSDEWMDVFERDAANANSGRLRDLYSRLLAGEIRKPGAFCLSTLRLVTILDTNLASLFERITPFVVDSKYLIKELVDPVLTYDQVLELEAAGILITGGGMLQMQKQVTAEGNIILNFQELSIVAHIAKPNGGSVHALPAFALTRAGAELSTLSSTLPDYQGIIDYVWDRKGDNVRIGRQTIVGGQKMITDVRPAPRSS